MLSLPKLGDATWVAADETRSSYADRVAPLPAAAALARLRQSPDWELVFERDGVLVFHKRTRVERDEHEVPREQRPDLRADRPERVVVEVPGLREHERGDEQDARRDAAERGERDQPDEVLRREHLRERQEAGDARREGDPRSTPPRAREPARRQRAQRRPRARRSRSRARPAGRRRGRARRAGARATTCASYQPSRSAARSTLAPRLSVCSAAPDLRVEAVPDAARREREPRHDEHGGGGGERDQRPGATRPALRQSQTSASGTSSTA